MTNTTHAKTSKGGRRWREPEDVVAKIPCKEMGFVIYTKEHRLTLTGILNKATHFCDSDNILLIALFNGS